MFGDYNVAVNRKTHTTVFWFVQNYKIIYQYFITISFIFSHQALLYSVRVCLVWCICPSLACGVQSWLLRCLVAREQSSAWLVACKLPADPSCLEMKRNPFLAGLAHRWREGACWVLKFAVYLPHPVIQTTAEFVQARFAQLAKHMYVACMYPGSLQPRWFDASQDWQLKKPNMSYTDLVLPCPSITSLHT